MRSLSRLFAVAAACALAACAAVQPKTPAQAVWEARAAFDAGPLNVAAGYASLPFCPQAQGKPCADPEVVVQIAKAKGAAVAAWNAAEKTVRDNPQTDAQVAISGTKHAVEALQVILDTYGIK
jgi:hypothetical protein